MAARRSRFGASEDELGMFFVLLIIVAVVIGIFYFTHRNDGFTSRFGAVNTYNIKLVNCSKENYIIMSINKNPATTTLINTPKDNNQYSQESNPLNITNNDTFYIYEFANGEKVSNPTTLKISSLGLSATNLNIIIYNSYNNCFVNPKITFINNSKNTLFINGSSTDVPIGGRVTIPIADINQVFSIKYYNNPANKYSKADLNTLTPSTSGWKLNNFVTYTSTSPVLFKIT